MLMGDKHRKYKNVYIKNFDDELDDDRLREMFEQYGKIISAKVMYDRSGKSRGFGFVSFEEPEAAERAVTIMNGSEMGGKQLYCGPAQKNAERQVELKEKFEKIKQERIGRYQGVNLYVKNFDKDVDDERLRKEFSQFGTITSVKVIGEGGRSRGFGFVCFSSPEEATKAVTEMNGHIIGAKPLYVALAQRKEDRRAHLAAIQHIQRMATIRQQNVQCNPIFNAGYAGYFLPTMPQAQGGFFTPTNGPSVRQTHNPWLSGITPNQAAAFCGAFMAGMIHPHGAALMPQTGGQPAAYPSGLRQMPGQPGGPLPQPHQYVLAPGQDPLTASMLAAAPPQEQKQILSDRLLPLIQRMYPDLAGKITGMLLEIDNSELLHMLESHESLKLKVEEAVAVLQAHQAKEQAATKKD